MVLQAPATYPLLNMAGRKSRAYNTSDIEPGTFGYFIRRARLDVLHMTQSQFAAHVGDNMDPTDVSQLERGKVGLPDPPRMIALAQALKMPVAALYAEAGYPEFLEGIPTQVLREWRLLTEQRRREREEKERPAG